MQYGKYAGRATFWAKNYGRSTCSDVADGAIEQGYGSKRGSIPMGRREVASLMVVILYTHYGSEQVE